MNIIKTFLKMLSEQKPENELKLLTLKEKIEQLFDTELTKLSKSLLEFKEMAGDPTAISKSSNFVLSVVFESLSNYLTLKDSKGINGNIFVSFLLSIIEKTFNYFESIFAERPKLDDKFAAFIFNLHGGDAVLRLLSTALGFHLDVDGRLQNSFIQLA